MATPTDSRLGASTNGELADRVQQLRLDNQLGTGRSVGGGSWLPWVLCGLLAITWAGVGVRWYKSAPQKEDVNGAPGPSTGATPGAQPGAPRSEEHTSELQSLAYLVCRLLLEKKKNLDTHTNTLRHPINLPKTRV